MSLLEERIRRSTKNRPPAGTAVAKSAQAPVSSSLQTSPEARPTGTALRGPRPASAYYSSDNKNTRSETEERHSPRPVSGVFAMELEQTVQRAAGLRGNIDSSIHIDLVQVNFEDILNEQVPLPRYK